MERACLFAFGRHLRAIRQGKELSQWDVACNGDFDRNYIGMLERGERNPSLLSLVRLAKALDVSLAELVDFDIDT